MRVMFDHTAFTRQSVGGITRYIASVASQINNLSLAEARVFAHLHFNEHLEELRSAGTVGRYIPRFRGADRLLPVINEALHRRAASIFSPDILHETHYSGRSYPSGKHVPIVYTVHDLIPELFPAQFGHYSKFVDRRRKAFKSSAYFVCISHSTCKDFQRLFDIPDERLTVIHHGGPTVVRQPLTERQSSVLLVGNRKGYKNFDVVLKAFASSETLRSNVLLSIFGGGELTNQERQQIAASGIVRFEHLHGDDAALTAAYRKCGLFVYPSRYEGFGLPLLEAMAAGAPVVCARASCFPEIAGDAAEYFDPDQPEQLSSLIERLIADVQLTRQLTQAGYDRAATFTWQRCAEQHVAFYERILGSSHG